MITGMIVDFADLTSDARETLAHVSRAAAAAHNATWLADLDAARAEIAAADRKLARVWLADGAPVGWIGAEHAWGRIWELHPLLVSPTLHGRGIGRALVRDLEALVAARGALTMMVGTSDDAGATSLAGVDLYADLPMRLARIEVHRAHAVAFWQRVGYTIVGVIPDAEGPGKPSIQLARRLSS